jgi:hypothetical protein
VSIHLSGSDDPGADRTDVIVGRSGHERRRSLGAALQRRLSAVTGAPGAVVEADLGVVAGVRHDPGTAACLAEVAFLTNPAQSARLAERAYVASLADALAAGIREGLAGSNGNGRAPLPMTAARSLSDTPADRARAEVEAAVARGEVDRATADTFLRSLLGDPAALGQTLAMASVPRQLDGQIRVARPTPDMVGGWQTRAILAALTATPVPGSFLVPAALLALCDEYNVTVGVGPALTGVAVVGGSLGVGVVFAPGGRVGLFGSIAALGGWAVGVSATAQVTVVKGGPEVFGGDSVGVSVGGGEGIVGSVTVLLDPNTQGFQGVTAAVGVGGGLTPIEFLMQYQWTAQTLARNGAGGPATLGYRNGNGNGRSLAVPYARPLTGFSDWERLISFRPPTWVQRKLKEEHDPDWNPHPIESALGPVNLDYYPVTVTRLPSFAATPEDLLAHIRGNINAVIDTTKANFAPYDAATDGPLWTSSSPTGAVIHIDMLTFSGWVNPDDGSVVCAEAAPDHWIFSTIWTVGDGAHPVSGNREFGFSRGDDGSFTFYTRGADRTTGVADWAGAEVIFRAADELWRSLQSGIVQLVNTHGGSATAGVPISNRHDWDTVKASHWHPSVDWEGWW